jgi:hypothetical protein
MAIVRNEQVSERWQTLFENAQGNAEKIFTETERLIKESKAPNVRVVRRKISPGMLRGLLGGKRDFLIVTVTGNSNLAPYQMFINARDYGNNLDVAWYLTHRITFWQKLILFLCLVPIINILVIPLVLLQRVFQAGKSGMLELDLFDEQDLTAYVTNAHHCLKEAVTKMQKELGQDTSKIDWKSKGFLGIS